MSTATSTLDRPAATSDRRVRVLLVEDTDAVRRAVALGLRSSGFEVTAVRGAEDALAVYAAVQPEVIITDLAMPGMDGFELIATLRVRGVDVPVLVITARDSARDRAAASRRGRRRLPAQALRPGGAVRHGHRAGPAACDDPGVIRNVVVGRLKDGVTPEEIEPALQALRDLKVEGVEFTLVGGRRPRAAGRQRELRADLRPRRRRRLPHLRRRPGAQPDPAGDVRPDQRGGRAGAVPAALRPRTRSRGGAGTRPACRGGPACAAARRRRAGPRRW